MMRVLIVDDHALVRAGIDLLLGHQDDMEPVGQAGTAAEAIKLARDLEPDIILLDVTMPGGGGLEALPALATAAPSAKVLMLSMHEDPNYVRAALGAGASGYVLKDAAYEELVNAIRKVAAGEAYVAPALGAKLAVRSEPDDDDELSEREREVLSPTGAWVHEPGDRVAALRERSHGRVAPGSHPREAAALDARRPRQLRTGDRVAATRNGTLDRRRRSPRRQAPDTVSSRGAAEPCRCRQRRCPTRPAADLPSRPPPDARSQTPYRGPRRRPRAERAHHRCGAAATCRQIDWLTLEVAPTHTTSTADP